MRKLPSYDYIIEAKGVKKIWFKRFKGHRPSAEGGGFSDPLWPQWRGENDIYSNPLFVNASGFRKGLYRWI